MLSYSEFPKQIIINFKDYSSSQHLSCQNGDVYKYVRNRLGNQFVTSNGQKFGPYLYRNMRNNVLIASWEKPSNKEVYTSYNIGMNADALIYYKNE